MTKQTISRQAIEQPELNILDWSLRDLAGFLPDALIILNETMQILYLNSAAETMFGYLTGEVVGQKLDALIPEQYMENHYSSKDGLHQMEESWLVCGKHRAGNLIPLEMPVTQRKYKNQTFIICSPRKSSDRRTFELALNEKPRHYRKMNDSQSTLAVRVDGEGRLIFANKAYCELFGKELSELIRKPVTHLMHTDNLPKTMDAVKDLKKEPYHIVTEQLIMTAKGWRWIAWENSVIQNNAEDIDEIQWIGIDITEHKDIETELSTKNSLLIGLVNSIPDITFYKDAQGIYLGCNLEFSRLVGKPGSEIVNKTDYDLFDQQTADTFRKNDREMIKQGKPRHDEEWVKYPDGRQILVDTLKAPLYSADDKPIGVVGISRDITMRKRAEEIANSERNLAISLAQKTTLAEALPLCLDLALQVSDMDCGGIYWVDHQKQELVLITRKGLSDEFVAQSSKYEKGSAQYQLVLTGMPLYLPYTQLQINQNLTDTNEGLHFFAMVPVRFNDKVIACLNVASHSRDGMPDFYRSALEDRAIHIGSVLTRFQTQDKLRESQAQLQTTFDALDDYIFILSSTGVIIEINQKVLNNLGYSRNELIGANILKVHTTDQQTQAWEIRQGDNADTTNTCEIDLTKKDGSRIPVETKVVPGYWGDQPAVIGVCRDVSARKKTELSMRKFSQLVDQSPSSIIITDVLGNIEYVNPEFTQLTGYSLQEVIGQNPRILKSEKTSPETYKRLWNTITLGFSWHGELCNRKKNGELYWESVVISPVMGDDKKITHFVGTKQDITGIKSSENQRREQTRLTEYHQKIEEALTSMSTHTISINSADLDPEINYILKQIVEFEKIDRGYVFQLDNGTDMLSNTHEWCGPGIEPQIEYLKNIPANSYPWLMRKLEKLQEVYIPKVSELPVEAQAERDILEAQAIQSLLVIPLTMHNRLIGFLGFESTVKERVWSSDSILLLKMVGDLLSNTLTNIRAKHDLLLSETRNKALLSAVPDSIFRIRRDGNLLDYKPSSIPMPNLSTQQAADEFRNNDLPDVLIKEIMNHIDQVLEKKETQTMEYAIEIDGASHVFEARIKDSGLDEVTAIVRDISERTRLEQMKSDFINRATHELRTPIATMLLMVSMLDDCIIDPDYREYWDVLKGEINRERLLIANILSAGRLESNQLPMHFQAVDITEIVNQVVDQIEPSAREKNIAISLPILDDLDENYRIIQADETALTQVFVNLLGNAINFTHPIGSVCINLKSSSSGIEISIADTGIGIPSDDIPMLFSRFFRGTNAIQEEIQGTGIGLFIVQSILEKHGGTIQVHSQMGLGTQFDIWLPLDHS